MRLILQEHWILTEGILVATREEYALLKYIMLESNPSDARFKIADPQVCQTLKERMGTGGNNVPLVLTFTKRRRAQNKNDYETWEESSTTNTLNTFEGGDVRATDLVISYGFEPGVVIEGEDIDREKVL